MDAGNEVEFYTDDGSLVAAADDAAEIGPGRVPRWVILLACALLAVAVLSAVVTSSDSRRAAEPPASAAPTATLPTGLAVVAINASQVGPAVHALDGAKDVLGVVVHRTKLYALRADSVSVLDLATGRAESIRLAGADAVPRRSSARLVLDADADRLWVFGVGGHSARLLEFTAGTLLPVRRVTVPFAVRDGAAMAGHLYLATSRGLADLAPAASSVTVLPGIGEPVLSVAADPARGRVLALQAPIADAIVVVSVGRVTSKRLFGNLTNSGSLTVVDDQIWIGGANQDGAVVARLDPVTLAPAQTSAVALLVDGVVLWAGSRDFWVSSGGRGLWCVDARTGEILEHWPTASAPVSSKVGHGPVTSRLGAAYARDAGSVVPLVLQGCAG